jgi:hypothetical protein
MRPLWRILHAPLRRVEMSDDDNDPGQLDDEAAWQEALKLLRRSYELAYYLETDFGREEVEEYDRVQGNTPRRSFRRGSIRLPQSQRDGVEGAYVR